jgi:archaeal flagellin FlaB
MLKRLLRKIYSSEKGITGLETAIILIAFVVVAAVFAYTVLSAGLFATQKSQEAVYSGIKEVQSTVEMKGSVVATADAAGAAGKITTLTFTVANALGGEPIDFTVPSADGAHTGLAAAGSSNVVVMSYVDKDQRLEDLYWSKAQLGSGDSDNLLDPGEKFQITIGGTAGGPGSLVQALATDLTINRQFTLEIKTSTGAVMTFQRTTPATMDLVMTLN